MLAAWRTARTESGDRHPADISGLDVLGDQLGGPDDATLALMAAALADAESFDRPPPCPATAS